MATATPTPTQPLQPDQYPGQPHVRRRAADLQFSHRSLVRE